jgi:adenylate kinase
MLFVVLMGGPGAGKGTQARLLKDSVNLPQIASGDLFRENFARNTKLGKVAREYVDSGDLVPDEVTIAMVNERLTRSDVANGAILDGFPRTITQAEDLDALLADMDEYIDIVPYIHVDRDVLLKRLAGRWTCRAEGHSFHETFNPPKQDHICDIDGSELYQRDDDTEETQRRRIEVYFEQTAPLLDYYRDKGLLAEINGVRTIAEVQNDLVEVVRSAASVASSAR